MWPLLKSCGREIYEAAHVLHPAHHSQPPLSGDMTWHDQKKDNDNDMIR